MHVVNTIEKMAEFSAVPINYEKYGAVIRSLDFHNSRDINP